MSGNNAGQLEQEDLDVDEKLNLLITAMTELSEQVAEVIEKLDNLGLPGTDYEILES